MRRDSIADDDFTTSLAGATETDAAADLAFAAQSPDPLDAGTVSTLIVPKTHDLRFIDTEQLLARPARKRGATTLFDAESFAAYYNRHSEAGAQMYADAQASSIVAVLNGHVTDATEAGWGDHRASLKLRKTPAWLRWEALDGKIGPQQVFAEHIEVSLPDIVTPPGAEMLELAQSFQAKTAVTFESGKRISNGETKLTYREDTTATAGQKGDLTIPNEFEIGVAPYEGSARYKVICRLRYRITSGGLQIGFVMDRPEDVLRTAFDDVLAKVEEATSESALHGMPVTVEGVAPKALA
jgi:uncharacterized protein YfdQ (DUF2303 family)